MSVLVVGDVHGCAAELEALLTAARPRDVVLVGDLFTKGPDPAGVWRTVQRWGADAVLGNHDQRLLDALAGQRPGDRGAAACVAALDAEGPAWRSWLAARPLFLDLGDAVVVHAGLHPDGPAATDAATALAVRRWPPGDPLARPWTASYRGARDVVYGHDARRGLTLTTTAGGARLYGLDTGCVYGGQLTGLMLPQRALVQVPALARYSAVGR